MSSFGRMLFSLTLGTVLLVSVSAMAQLPDKFENLKVLPKDIGKREMMDVMRSFSTALGVRCGYCHVGENVKSLRDYDFKSDDKHEKRVAREMLKMVGTINNDLIAAIDLKDPTRVRCVTCHRGLSNPETLDNVLLDTAKKDGTDAAVTQYKDLREQFYGNGSYNFSTSTLSTVAESLVETDAEGAVKVARLNVEINESDPVAHAFLGQVLMRTGDKDGAIKSFERALEIDPENDWAKRMLERVKASE